MEFDELKRKISQALENLHKNKVLSQFRTQFFNRQPVFKDIKFAERAKAEGNILYRTLTDQESSLHYEALHLYNKSIAFAPIGSEEVANAYSNKSALLKRMRKYLECITEIDNAFKVSQSTLLKIKLLCRKSECLTAIGSSDNLKYFNKAKFLLSKLESEKEVKVKKSLTRLIKGAQKTLDEGKLDTPKKNRRKIEASTQVSEAEKQSASRSVEPKHSDKYGRHLIAKRDFTTGEILLVDKPFQSHIDDSKVHQYCCYCLNYLWTIVACDNCAWRAYCSEKCKNQAWDEYHEMECSVLCHMRANPLQEPKNFMVTFLVTIFFKALKQAGSIGRMMTDFEVINKDEDPLHKGFSSDGEFSSYKSLYSVPIPNHDKSTSQFAVTCTITALTSITKYSTIFGTTYDVQEMKKLKRNEAAIFVGALLLKSCLIICEGSFRHGLFDPSEQINLSHNKTPLDIEGLPIRAKSIETDGAFYLRSMLIAIGCLPNVQFCATFGNKFILYALQPIKAGSQLFCNKDMSCVYTFAPKSLRQAAQKKLYNCVCECIACTEDWTKIIGEKPTNWSHTTREKFVPSPDFNIANIFPAQIYSILRDWNHNSHKQNYPTVKVMSELRDAITNVWKDIPMPSQLVVMAISIMKMMYSAFFDPSEKKSKNSGLRMKQLITHYLVDLEVPPPNE